MQGNFEELRDKLFKDNLWFEEEGCKSIISILLSIAEEILEESQSIEEFSNKLKETELKDLDSCSDAIIDGVQRQSLYLDKNQIKKASQLIINFCKDLQDSAEKKLDQDTGSQQVLPNITPIFLQKQGAITLTKQITVLLKQAQKDQNQPEQIRLYQLLAEEYRKEKNYINVTAIYNFALALCEPERDAEIASNINQTLAGIEIEFLQQITESDKSANIEKSEATITLFSSRNQENRNDIKDIRTRTGAMLAQCQVTSQAPHRNQTDSDTLTESQFTTPTITTQQIHHTTSQSLREFVKDLIIECKSDLAKIGLILPDNFHYAIICFGSLARDEATPYSDLEFGILIDDQEQDSQYSPEQKQQRKEQAKEYFRILTKLLNIKIINLGETTITIQDIEELKGLPSPTKNGFSFDGNAKGSCKTPLGNMHHVRRDSEKIESNTELSEEQKSQAITTLQAESYELIMTPIGLAALHSEEWFKRDNHFSTVLSTTALIEASNQQEAARLITKYEEESDKILDQSISSTRYQERLLTEEQQRELTTEELETRALELSSLPNQITLRIHRAFLLLQEAVGRFNPTGGRAQEQGRTFSVKYDFYRMPMILINHLVYLSNIKDRTDKPTKSIWDKFDRLFVGDQETPAIFPINNQEGIENLRWMINRVLQIRLKTYLAKGAQDEDMLFDDKQIKEMFEVYYVMLVFYDQAKSFVVNKREERFQEDIKFPDLIYYDDSDAKKGWIYNLLLDYNKALKCYDMAVKVTRAKFGNNPDVATSLNNVGNAYSSLGDHKEAVKYYEESLEIRRKIFGKNHFAVVAPLNNLGNAYGSLGDHQKEVKYLIESLEITERIFGKNHHDVAISLNNLGNAYSSLKNYQEAIKCHEEALKIMKRIFGEIHHNIAGSLTSLGNAYYFLENYQEAVKYLEESIKMTERIFGRNYPIVAISLNNLGNVYSSAGNDLKAIKCYKESLKIREAIFGDGNIEVASSLNNLGSVYDFLGNHQQAVEYLKKSLEIRKKMLGIDHHDVVVSLNNLGSAYGSLGDYLEAIKCYTESLEIRERISGKNHPNYKKILANIKKFQLFISCNLLLQNNPEEVAKYYNPVAKENLKKTLQTLSRGYYQSQSLTDTIFCYQYLINIFEDCKQDHSLHHNLASMYHVAVCRLQQLQDKSLECQAMEDNYLKLTEEHFKESISLQSTSPNNAEYANFLIKQKREKEATDYLFKAIELENDNGGLSYNKLEKIILDSHLQQLLDTEISFKASFFAYYLLVNLYHSQNNLDEATRLCSKFLVKVENQEESYSVSYFLLAKSFEVIGKIEEAQVYLAKFQDLQIKEKEIKQQKKKLILSAQQKVMSRLSDKQQDSELPIQLSSPKQNLHQYLLDYDFKNFKTAVEELVKNEQDLKKLEEESKTKKESQTILGYIYLRGLIPEKTTDDGLQLLIQASEDRFIPANLILANFYLKIDKKLSNEYLQKAKDLGYQPLPPSNSPSPQPPANIETHGR